MEETVEKIEDIEEENKIPIKIEEEKEKKKENSHGNIAEDVPKEEDNSFNKDNVNNMMFFQNQMQSYFQGLWMGQMGQNYLMQNYNNWVNFNKFKNFLSNQSK